MHQRSLHRPRRLPRARLIREDPVSQRSLLERLLRPGPWSQRSRRRSLRGPKSLRIHRPKRLQQKLKLVDTSAAMSILHGALLGALKENIDDETDEAEKEKLKNLRQAMKNVQRERPRQSILITPEHVRPELPRRAVLCRHRTVGIPHHLAWKA